MLIFDYLVDLRVKRQKVNIVSDKREHILNALKVILRGKGGRGVDICDFSCFVLCTYSYMYEILIFHNKK